MYIDESGQWVYMFDIIDVYTREIVGHHESLGCRTKEALAALKQAADNRNTENLTLRTDTGTQFRSRQFQRKLKELDIPHEITTVNTPEENAHIESFHGTLKRSEIYRKHYSNITRFRESIANFIDRHKNRRPYSTVGKIPPAVYHKNIVNNLISRVEFAA
ncbi:MAG: transposase [Bacillota bacterium]